MDDEVLMIAKQLVYLQMQVKTLKELLISKEMIKDVNADLDLDIDVSVTLDSEGKPQASTTSEGTADLSYDYESIITEDEFNEKYEEILGRDETELLFLKIGRNSVSGQIELDEMLRAAKGPASDPYTQYAKDTLKQWLEDGMDLNPTASD